MDTAASQPTEQNTTAEQISDDRVIVNPAARDGDHNIVAGPGIVGERQRYAYGQPFAAQLFDVGDGQQVYVEQSGNPDGAPVVFVHGGPGGGIGEEYRGFFNPEKYHVIGFDQRGCGQSTPHVSTLRDPSELDTNTTQHLIADMELIRTSLGIDRWGVFGGSWGSTLSLAYAQTHPQHVAWLILRGIFTLRRSELDWYYNGGAHMVFPDQWQHYLEPLRAAGMDLDTDKMASYHKLLWHDDPRIAQEAGLAWTRWEASTSNLLYPADHVAEATEPAAALAFARIENHYFVNHGFMREGSLIEGAERLADIPGVIVQGRYDMCCPAITSYELHQAWPQADYRVVLAGHSAWEPLISSELVKATDDFADLR